jgi:hypothetical protein
MSRLGVFMIEKVWDGGGLWGGGEPMIWAAFRGRRTLRTMTDMQGKPIGQGCVHQRETMRRWNW